MTAGKILLIVIILFVVVLAYSCCVAASRADDRAKKMYQDFILKEKENMNHENHKAEH